MAADTTQAPDATGDLREAQVELPLTVDRIAGFYNRHLNTLRTGDADLRFYITTVQDG